MNHVTLIFTVHDGIGLANSSELHAILEGVRPETIYLEVPLAAFGDFYESYTQHNLESVAVRRYRQSHAVQLLPVDLPTPSTDFFSDIDRLSKEIREESSEYRRLMDLDRAWMAQHGFSYLNSERCSALWSGVYREMAESIERMGDAGLVEIYDHWVEMNNLRERKMIGDIQKRGREGTYGKGVFLVGAAHRGPILDILSRQSAADATGTHWDLLTL